MSAPTVTPASVIDGMPAEEYHAHPALSSSGARLLLPPNCPALFRWRQDHPEPRKSAYDLGQAAHLQALGIGPDVVVVDAADWRTKAAKEARADAYEIGAVPLLAAQYDDVRAMADALRTHPAAGPLLNPVNGVPEQSLFWTDRRTGVPRRARIDWRTQTQTGRAVIVDYKTAASASHEAVQRAVHAFGYHVQAAWYLDGARVLGLADDDAVVQMVFQERTPPYLVNVVQLDPQALRIGRILARDAIDTFVACTESGDWPGYSDTVTYVSMPTWVEAQYREGTW